MIYFQTIIHVIVNKIFIQQLSHYVHTHTNYFDDIYIEYYTIIVIHARIKKTYVWKPFFYIHNIEADQTQNEKSSTN